MDRNGSRDEYEYCPNCDANLTMQRGYHNDLPYWICKGCGEMLINPRIEAENDIIWCCDGCGALLNVQNGFDAERTSWKCTECGFENSLEAENIYLSEGEYQAELNNPYKGLTDPELLELFSLEEERALKENVILVRDPETEERFVKKILAVYDRSIYEYLKDHPIRRMPRIISVYEGSGHLIVIEEHITGRTIEELLEKGPLPADRALDYAINVCTILERLHALPTPIVHRDVKPSNIIVTPEDEVYLLDVNVAKWYDPDKSDDTRHMGTQTYAAPEQAGYGLKASSAKADIYAMGVLLNKMIVGKFPKEERAPGRLWSIIERCICLEAEKRYTAAELKAELVRLSQERAPSLDKKQSVQ